MRASTVPKCTPVSCHGLPENCARADLAFLCMARREGSHDQDFGSIHVASEISKRISSLNIDREEMPAGKVQGEQRRVASPTEGDIYIYIYL